MGGSDGVGSDRLGSDWQAVTRWAVRCGAGGTDSDRGGLGSDGDLPTLPRAQALLFGDRAWGGGRAAGDLAQSRTGPVGAVGAPHFLLWPCLPSAPRAWGAARGGEREGLPG